jgi:uncharacterized protein
MHPSWPPRKIDPQMKMRNLTSIALTLTWLMLATVSAAQDRNPDRSLESLDTFPRATLKIATPDARLHPFNVWIAADGARREQGLMFVKSLPEDSGMLFVYGAPQTIAMWMKNTFISLDMLFIRADGRVARVVANTKPHSLTTIESGESVLGVLELKAGTAAKLNIRAGARVLHPAFGSGK